MEDKQLSAKQYIRTKARTLPIEKCLVADLYENMGLTMCLLVRKQPDDKYTFASILVDRLCMGVKNSIVNCNFTLSEIEDYESRMNNHAEMEEVSPTYFHNLVFGALDYALELGLKPPTNFEYALWVLDESYVDDGINDIEMGWKGKPFYIQGPYDDKTRVLSKLKASVGEGNFDFAVEEF